MNNSIQQYAVWADDTFVPIEDLEEFLQFMSDDYVVQNYAPDDELFKHIREPYGTLTILVESTKVIEGTVYIKGTVVEGGTTNRFLHHTNTTSEVGKPYELAVSWADYKRGYQRTISM